MNARPADTGADAGARPGTEVGTDPATGRRTQTLRRSYPDPVEDVWAALTEPDRLARWYGTYTGDARPGATIELTVTGELDGGAESVTPEPVTIHACEAPHRLVVEVPMSGQDQAWLLTVELTAAGTGTDLVLTEVLPDAYRVEDTEAGWSWYLDRLRTALAGTTMPDWAAYAPGDGTG